MHHQAEEQESVLAVLFHKGKNKNIDDQIENKFNAFKAYAERHNLHWGFVRDKDTSLYINNTIFNIDMADDHWEPLDL